MNNKQKLGYMALGAGIMAIGITIGQFITPNIEAQSNGVFGEIQCSKLTVVNEAGRTAIDLTSSQEKGNALILFSPAGRTAVALHTDGKVASIGMSNNGGEGVVLFCSEDANGLQIFDEADESAITVVAAKGLGRVVTVSNEAGGHAVKLSSYDDLGNGVSVYDSTGNITWTAP